LLQIGEQIHTRGEALEPILVDAIGGRRGSV